MFVDYYLKNEIFRGLKYFEGRRGHNSNYGGKNIDDELKKLKVLNSKKNKFLSNMSQEIRTPMSGIIGMTELLMLTNLTKEQKEYLDIINFSSSALLAIINDILDFSRIESGELKLESIEFDIAELIRKTVKILEYDAKRKNVTLELNISENINYKVVADPLRLNQILINLIKNSLKHTSKGKVTVNFRENSKTEGISNLSLSVSDTGMGMSDKNIFSFYGDVDKNGKVILSEEFSYDSGGFGIPIIKHLVYLMKGEMYIKSKEKTGTDITINLPFKIAGEHTIISHESKTEVKSKTRQVKILLAEDNIVSQRLVKELLSRKNYEVTIVDNGLKIFDLLEKNEYDLILMDIQMPVMDGLEATSIIREIEKESGNHIPIIGVTAYPVKADREKCLSVGMDDYLSKPFVKEEFYAVLERYL